MDLNPAKRFSISKRNNYFGHDTDTSTEKTSDMATDRLASSSCE